MISRLIGFVFVLFSILLLPYWFYAISLSIAIIVFPFFWEGILLASLIDVFYGKGTEVLIVALILSLVLLPVRERLRFHA